MMTISDKRTPFPFFFFDSRYKAIAYAIFSSDIPRKQEIYILLATHETTAKIEFEDNFQIKATTNLVLCRRAVCSPFCSDRETTGGT